MHSLISVVAGHVPSVRSSDAIVFLPLNGALLTRDGRSVLPGLATAPCQISFTEPVMVATNARGLGQLSDGRTVVVAEHPTMVHDAEDVVEAESLLVLTTIDLWNVIRAASAVDLRDAGLRGADLSGAQLPNACLDGADLRRACLHGAQLHGASLIGANLEGCDLGRANLCGADLSGADLRRSDLRHAFLRGVTTTGAVFRGAELWSAILWDVSFDGAFLEGADLARADHRGTGQQVGS